MREGLSYSLQFQTNGVVSIITCNSTTAAITHIVRICLLLLLILLHTVGCMYVCIIFFPQVYLYVFIYIYIYICIYYIYIYIYIYI